MVLPHFSFVRTRVWQRRIGGLALCVATVYPMSGYGDPEPIVLSNRAFERYIARDVYTAGLSAEGLAKSISYALFAEHSTAENRHRGTRFAEQAAEDVWEATGWRLGGAAARSFAGDRVDASVTAEYALLNGDAYRSDLEGSAFRASESVIDAAAEVRYSAPSWTSAIRAGVHRDGRVRTDFVARAVSDIIAWTPSVSAEVARQMGAETWISAGVGGGITSAQSSLPDAEQLGPVYRRVIAPELALHASRAIPLNAALALRTRLNETSLVITTTARRVAPGGEAIPLVPGGSRTRWSVAAGVIF